MNTDRYAEYVKLGYDRPEPSLCDTCALCGFMEFGSVSTGGKTYPQRYCSSLRIGIHTRGLQECQFHSPIN